MTHPSNSSPFLSNFVTLWRKLVVAFSLEVSVEQLGLERVLGKVPLNVAVVLMSAGAELGL